MLSKNDILLIGNDQIAVCGVHVRGDAIHVGVFWNLGGEQRIVHFISGANIPVEDANSVNFNSYRFNVINDFPLILLPTLAAVSELVSTNQLNGFVFNRIGVIYDGGKFNQVDGAFTGKSGAEKFVNCAVFVIALLKTFDYTLLDWDSWPAIIPAQATFLETWLDDNNILANDRPAYYTMTKEVRGKHVLVCPQVTPKPAHYNQVAPLADDLIANILP